MKYFTFTKSEKEIMDLLWKKNRPLSAGQICDLLEDKSWKSSSIHIFINSLLKKGAIIPKDFVQGEKSYVRTFIPTMSADHYLALQVEQLTQRLHKDRVPQQVISALIHFQGEDTALLSELERMIRNKKEEQR